MTILKLTIVAVLMHYVYEKTDSYKLSNESKSPSPIILIPGDGGSRAYSYLDYYFFKHKRLVWVNFEYMVFPYLLRNVFGLHYDPKTHTTSDSKGSEVFFPGWGSTETIEELDENIHCQTTYFSPLVKSLIEDNYFRRNKTVRGAPYDFRKTPNENQKFFTDLQLLVEDTYNNTNGQKVMILGHSLGSLYSLYFFKTMTSSWKKKFIRGFISLSGPFGGAVKAVSLETSGASLGSPRNPIYFREMQRSFPSTVFLLPNPELFGNQSIVITKNRNYSSLDYEALFHDMSMPYGMMMYNDVKNLLNINDEPEDIDEVYCVYGYGSETPRQLIFNSFPDGQPYIIYGDGDYTVNIESLEVCTKWKNVQTYKFKGVDHMKIVGDPEFLNLLKQILYKQPNMQFPITETGEIYNKLSVQFF